MRQLVKEKENSELKPVKPRLKTDLVSYPAPAEGLINMVSYEIHSINLLKNFDIIFLSENPTFCSFKYAFDLSIAWLFQFEWKYLTCIFCTYANNTGLQRNWGQH